MLFNKNNLKVARVASKDSNRVELSSVYFTKDKTVATDSYCLVEMTTPQGLDIKDFPVVDKKRAIGFKPFMVKAESLKDIKLPVKTNLPILENLAVSYSDNDIVKLYTTDLTSGNVKAIKKVQGQFPDYEKIFPKKKARLEFKMDAKLLKKVLEAVGDLNKGNHITIKLYDINQAVVIEAENENQKARAMIMPIKQ